ncbi:xanthine dehydrogenase family protein molybdopterin-binding subunit [Salsipaludibacter albus]|uniref:xanthine dehydrogenase family protein molybdopterin-binding subunit n=1 Tax=Salsipaludibacter albus TaxID=2849650 RepID=UPI001EE47B98|nr:xanthine dehydrogenase family protein molybdopterin-binding subunit [Salsipaludibacter albus]MBY5163064.1 xanthine dehydrogenase family protein molybdopterin-binding subunit [Salsipaludibacter albus]
MTTTENPIQANVGRTRLRKEDARLVTGRTNFTDDIRLPGMVHMVVVRSPMAHAKVTNVDLTGALDMPGVVAAFSGADLADDAGGLPCAWPVTEDMVAPEHKALAIDEVAYVGDGVAVVLASTAAEAVDAAERVVVDYDPLPAVVDMKAAIADGADLAQSTLDTNVSYRWPLANGDIDAAFDGADVVVEREFVQQRLIPSAMEPRAVVAAPMGVSDELTVWSATQVPHFVRVFLAAVIGIDEQNLRVIAPDVGGGFGSKLDIYAEEILALVLAQKLGRPVKWTETRSEGFQATIHGRDQVQKISLAMDADGRFRGLKVDLLADMGAYMQLLTPGIPILGAFMYSGIYKMDAYDFSCRGVFTNKTPTDAYRGAGRPEATFAIERIVDEAAHELGVDPMELRKRNWIQHDEFPYEMIGTLTFDSGNYEAATARAIEMFDYDGRRAEQANRRDSGGTKQLGIGISTFTEMCGLAPSRVLGNLRYVAGGWEYAQVRMLFSGKVEVITGTSPHGQGHDTAWSQIAADALGVPFEDIIVRHGDTAVSHRGLDTYGSRSLVVGGAALAAACGKVVEKARRVAAHLLEADEDDVEFSDGAFRVVGSPETSMTMQEVSTATFVAHDLPDGMEPSLDSDASVDPDNFSYPHGTHLALVEVDTETGQVELLDYVSVDDVGNVVNPQIVEGQVHGGLAQGIAQALYEGAVYDQAGNLQTGSFVDYYVPGAPDFPTFRTDRTVTPATTNDLGVKGVGEAGTIASTPAIINGVIDAVRHLGVNEVLMPASPRNVWTAIQQAAASGSADSDDAQAAAAVQADDAGPDAAAADNAGQAQHAAGDTGTSTGGDA